MAPVTARQDSVCVERDLKGTRAISALPATSTTRCASVSSRPSRDLGGGVRVSALQMDQSASGLAKNCLKTVSALLTDTLLGKKILRSVHK